MSEFKVGDRVRRVGGNNDPEKGVFLGGEYIVDRSKEDRWITLSGVGGDSCWWDPDYFELVELQYPNPPHKHRDLIIAWANGAEIEFYSKICSGWSNIKNPCWSEDTQYRIKPTKSAKDIEIEQIQAEMDKLKERLEKVKEGK